jgi:hypothetical protein
MRSWLLPVQKAGKIDVEEEFQQACFHITVYKSYVPPMRTPKAAQTRTAKQRTRQTKPVQRNDSQEQKRAAPSLSLPETFPTDSSPWPAPRGPQTEIDCVPSPIQGYNRGQKHFLSGVAGIQPNTPRPFHQGDGTARKVTAGPRGRCASSPKGYREAES